MVNKSYKFIKYIFYILCIISLFFSIKSKVKADSVQFTMNNIKLAYYNTNFSAGGYCTASGGTYICSTNNGVLGHWIDIQFKPSQYWGYPGYWYTFAIQFETSVGNMTPVAYAVTDKNYNVLGTCQSYTNSTGQITSLVANCYISNSGLKNDTNILRLSATTIKDNNQWTTAITPQTTVFMVENYYSSMQNDYTSQFNNLATNTTNINNSINNQTNTQHQDATNINNSIKDTNNTIKDSSVDTSNANNTFSGLNNSMASNNTISQLLLMPVRLLQKLLNAFSNGCSAINTGEIFGYELVLPCIDLQSLLGSALWNVIDVIGSGALAYAIGKKMIKIFNQFTNLKEGGLESAYD